RSIADMNRRFGDPVHVDQTRRCVAMTVEPRTQCEEIESFSAEDHKPQRQRSTGSRLFGSDKLVERCRGLVEHSDPLSLQELVKVTRGAGNPIRNNDEPSPGEQAAPNLPDREIESG